MYDDDLQTVIIDNGSSMIKAGFAGDEAPRYIFPSVVGSSKYTHWGAMMDIFVGNEACAKRSILDLKYPIERGIIKNWDDMERIWRHTFFKVLKVDPSENSVFMTSTSTCTIHDKEKMAQIMLEFFDAQSFFISPQAVLSLYVSGDYTGIICEIGDGITQIVPIYKGYIFNNAVKCIDFGGCDITKYSQKLLKKRGFNYLFPKDKEYIDNIKEKYAYVALDYDEELEKAKSSKQCDVSFKDDLGKNYTIGSERFTCSELLFKPYMDGFEFDGVYKMIFDSIMTCNIGARKDLFANIVLSGGSTMFKGFPERIEREITNMALPYINVNVKAAPDRKYNVFNGASVMASLATYSKKVITHDEYKEVGPSIVRSKCL